jgi:hypothetical protein
MLEDNHLDMTAEMPTRRMTANFEDQTKPDPYDEDNI